MAKKKELTKATPAFPTITKNGKTYFRTRLTDADGKRFDLYGKTEEELAQKIANAQKEIEEAKIRRMNPTVEEMAVLPLCRTSLKWFIKIPFHQKSRPGR